MNDVPHLAARLIHHNNFRRSLQRLKARHQLRRRQLALRPSATFVRPYQGATRQLSASSALAPASCPSRPVPQPSRNPCGQSSRSVPVSLPRISFHRQRNRNLNFASPHPAPSTTTRQHPAYSRPPLAEALQCLQHRHNVLHRRSRLDIVNQQYVTNEGNKGNPLRIAAGLTQDGHQIEHVRPPRDLQSWQQLPIYAIANFQPVILHKLDRAEIQSALKAHPYQRFPVELDGKPAGILTRREAEAAVTENRQPKLERLVICLRGQTIRDLQMALIDSTSQFVVVLDRPDGTIVGRATLHDLLVPQRKKQGTATIWPCRADCRSARNKTNFAPVYFFMASGHSRKLHGTQCNGAGEVLKKHEARIPHPL